MGDDILVRARGLTKRFGDFTAVDGIDVDVRRGEAFGFLGPNGAGKSSTMRMVGCVSPVTEGELTILGLDPASDGPAIRARLGVCPQNDILDEDLSVEENLWVYGRFFGLSRARGARAADELLEFAQLTERRHDRVEPLSGGMKRRLTIARSLMNDPEVLLLDEPTTGLDPQARHVLWDRLFRLKREGVTLIVTTHYMDEAEQLCDRLVVMDHGRIVAEGSPRALIDEHSTREVLELRFDPDEQEQHVDAVTGVGERLEVLPDRLLVYAHDGDARARQRARPRRPAAVVARAPLDARGRLPPPHRPQPGRLMSTTTPSGSPRARRAAASGFGARRPTTTPERLGVGHGAPLHGLPPHLARARSSAASCRRCSSCCRWAWAWGRWSTTAPAASTACRTCSSSCPASSRCRR